MRIDHLVLNIDKKYQVDNKEIEKIRNAGFPYQPKWGKGTKGFKASNLWIDNEYFEMIRLIRKDGGGWTPSWVQKYNNGHRGLICLMLDVEDIDKIYAKMNKKGIELSQPKFLQFKWFFNLLTRTMPWRNSYFKFFEGVPFQIGLQQMKDQKAVEFMHQYMVPNSKENGINGIKEVIISGKFTDNDFILIKTIFENSKENKQQIDVELQNQKLVFIKNEEYSVKVKCLTSDKKYIGNKITIENVDLEINK